jgi:hypothetical protein
MSSGRFSIPQKKSDSLIKKENSTLLSKKLILGANDERRFSEDAHTMAPGDYLFAWSHPILTYPELT